MAVIRFYPEWIASRWQTGTYQTGFEEHFKYEFPFSTNHNAILVAKFDMEEISYLLNQVNIQNKYMHMRLGEGANPSTFNTYLMYNEQPPSETNRFMIELVFGTAYHYINKPLADHYTISLDTSLYRAGPSGPISLSLQQAINHGTEGVGIQSPGGSGNEIYDIEDVFIELVGDFDNARPTPTSPVGGNIYNRFETIHFSWNHNSSLPQESYELRYRKTGTSDWTTIQNNHATPYFNLDAGTLDVAEYEWQVRTTSEYDFVSPWSLTQVFNAGEVTPSPVFINPTNESVVEVSDLHVEWSSVEQHRYEIELLNESNNAIWSDARISSNNEITVPNILENGQSYRLRLRVNQENNFFSPWVQISFDVDYTQPASPIIEITPNKELSNLTLYIENPTPTGTEPQAVNQELFKRKPGGDWIKLADLLTNSEYIDYAVASDQTYEYQVLVHGNNDTSTRSSIFNGSVKVKDAIISIANEPTEFVVLRLNPSRDFSIDFNATQKQFAGRKKSVTEFGEIIDLSGSLGYLVTKETMDKLMEMAYRQETIIYRDGRGRFYYGMISNLNVNDDIKFKDFYDISLNFSEVDYKEGID